MKKKKTLKEKIVKALLNTSLADKLIDKYLAKQTIIDIANDFYFD